MATVTMVSLARKKLSADVKSMINHVEVDWKFARYENRRSNLFPEDIFKYSFIDFKELLDTSESCQREDNQTQFPQSKQVQGNFNQHFFPDFGYEIEAAHIHLKTF